MEAKSFYLYSLYIFKQNKRWEHSDAIYPRNGLANLYAIEGNYREAEKLYIESREIRMRILGEKHPQIAYIYHNLAVLYTKQGNYKNAISLYECSLLVWIQKLGLKHRHTRICAHNYAILYHLLEAGAEVPEIKTAAASNRHDLCVLPTYRSARL